MSFTLKIKFNDDVRRITLDKTPKFAELKIVLGDLFKSLPENYALKYVDEEEDLITISSDMELEEAFDLAKKSPIKILRLTITAESATAPFVVNQNDISKLACNAMTGMVNAQGFQTLVSSPGFQQLVPQILNSDAFKQQLVPQLLNANNMQHLLPALTNVTPDLNNLFSALMPVIMNAVTANLQAQQAQTQVPQTQQQSTQTEPLPEKPAETTTPSISASTTPSPAPETTESKELLAKEIAAQFEVVEITDTETEQTPAAVPSPVQEKKNDIQEEVSVPAQTNSPAPAPAPAPAPEPEPTPAKVPEIPEQLVPLVRALIDMGFTDIAQNLSLLEKHNGNLLRVIELCLGEAQE